MLIACLPMLYMLTGAAIALYAYHMGRNNKSPITLPEIHIPFLRKSAPADEEPKPQATRGM